MPFKYFNRAGRIISCDILREGTHKQTGTLVGVVAIIPGFNSWPTGYRTLAEMKGNHPELGCPIIVDDSDIEYRDLVIRDGKLVYADEAETAEEAPATA